MRKHLSFGFIRGLTGGLTSGSIQLGSFAAVSFFLRNARKTECGAKQFLRTLAVRAAPFALLTSCLCAQPWTGIINSTRATNWSNAGATIPSATWTQCGPTIAAYGASGSPASAGTINSAIAACGANQYVSLGAGDFYLSSGVDFAMHSNVVLRGQGADQTRLHFNGTAGCNGWTADICVEGSNTYEGGYQGSANWTAGYSQGSTSITLDNVSGIVTGLTPIVLDQCNTGLSGASCSGNQTDNSNLYVCDVNSVCESESANGGYYRPLRAQIEVVVASSITGTGPYTVTLSDPIELPNWNSGQAPQAWWGNATITNSGVENLLIDNTNNGGHNGISLVTSRGCWVKGVASNDAAGYHIFNYLTSHNVIRDSYAFMTQGLGVQSYGIGGSVNGGLLIENNIMQKIVDPINWDAPCSGCVASYNFAVNQYTLTGTGYMFGMFSWHSAGDAMMLLEGNVGSQSDSDDIHGTHDMNTEFRNYFNGMESNNGFAAGTVTVNAGSGSVAWASGATFQNGWTSTPQEIWIYNPTSAQYVSYYLNSVNSSNSLSLSRGILSGGSGTVPYFVGTDVNTDAIHVAAYSRYYNVIGNVLGTPGFHTNYACVAPNQTTSPCPYLGTTPYDIGYSGNTHGESETSGAAPYDDPIAASSLLRWGNYDTVTGGVRWCGNSSDTGWSSTCGSTSEIPTGDKYYPNSIPTKGDTVAGQPGLPPSFVYSAQPAWWPSAKAWPPIGPDVSSGNIGQCTSGNYMWSKVTNSSQCAGGTFISASATTGGHAVSIPAMDCYLSTMGGPPDGTGAMLTFNASACYVPQSITSNPPPAPSLTAVAH
jgi:hypothetical protein